jgi:hypothetical protein
VFATFSHLSPSLVLAGKAEACQGRSPLWDSTRMVAFQTGLTKVGPSFQHRALKVCLPLFQLRVSFELHQAGPVGHRLRDSRRQHFTDDSSKQIALSGSARRRQGRLVSTFLPFLSLMDERSPQMLRFFILTTRGFIYAPRVVNYALRVINYASTVVIYPPRVINYVPREHL